MVRDDEKAFVVHQTLHGYSEGHRLLAASLRLPREAERAVLLLSDLSGQGMIEGFESYLTGYPLTTMNGYAFSKTWYAPEMERPGCVWTHTLIVGFEAVSRIAGLSALSGFFRRPSSPLVPKTYEKALNLESLPQWSRESLQEADLELTCRVIESLYGEPERPVVVGVKRAIDAEKSFLAVWGQQWPTLRQAFTFCTGSLSSRSFEGRTFDLQAAFLGDVKRFAKANADPSIIVREEANVGARFFPAWAKIAASDFMNASAGHLSYFVRKVGAELPPDRALFAPLLECYQIASEHSMRPPVGPLLTLLADRFPDPSAGESIKLTLLGQQVDANHGGLLQLSEPAVLRELSTTEFFRAFDGCKLQIQERAKTLWEKDIDAGTAVLRDLTTGPLTPLGEQFLAGVAEVLRGEPLRAIFTKSPDLVGRIVDKNPSLATNPEVWSLPLPALLSFIRILGERRQQLAPVLDQVSRAAFSSCRGEIAWEFVRELGDQTIPLVLNWIDDHPLIHEQISLEWREVFRAHARGCVLWLEKKSTVHPKSVLLLAMILDPDSASIRDSGSALWLKHAPVKGQLEPDDLVRVLAFYLAIAFAVSDKDAVRAAAIAFDPIYRNLENDTLDRRSWEILRDHLPRVPWWKDWDRCDRLRLAVVERFIGVHWPAYELFDLTQDDRIFRQLIDSFRESRVGKHFLRDLAKDVELGKLQTTSERLELIR